MALRQPAHVVATGIVFEEPHDPVEAFVRRHGFLSPDERDAIAEWRAGEVLLLTYAAFAEVDDGGGVRRWGGAAQGPFPVPTYRSATDTLMGLIDGMVDELLPALEIQGLKISRFEYCAAPHRIELGESIRRRLTLD